MSRISGTIDRRALFGLPQRNRSETPEAAARSVPILRQINARACIGCDVCVRICPRNALRLREFGARAFYSVDPDRCDGCGLCLEVCESGALVMAVKGSFQPQIVELSVGRCARCGASWRVPKARGEPGPLCRICAPKWSAESS